ncbi:MAG TPA: prolipoprotein diacylglyceryl transferase family protein [Actinomycetes bacterium]|nr:prolipoprotein diacylglyceryl transferase family protein [Actinomycetes bacterium]
MLALAVISYPPLVRIHLGPLAISPHGIMAALGFLAGAALLRRAAWERGIDEATVDALIMRAFIGGTVGARFFYVLNHPSEFASPLDWLRVWEGGLTLLGGIAGAVLAGLPLIMRRRLRLLQVLDAAVPGLALGIAIGRLGDLAIGDHLGQPTSFAFGYRCPPVAVVGETVGSPCPPGAVVHLTALYDLIGALLVFGALMWLRRRPRWEGQATLVFTVGYGLVRLVEGSFRTDKTLLLGLDGSQFTAALAITAAIPLFLLLRRRGHARSAT